MRNPIEVFGNDYNTMLRRVTVQKSLAVSYLLPYSLIQQEDGDWLASGLACFEPTTSDGQTILLYLTLPY